MATQVDQVRKQNRRGLATRERVLQAAFEVIADQPVAEVQIAHIAEKAGMTSGHVLYHFPSRDDLLMGTLLWSEARLKEQRRRKLAIASSTRDRFVAYVKIYLPTSRRDVSWKLWLEYWLRSARESDLRRSVVKTSISWLPEMHDLVISGIHDGTFRLVDVNDFVEWFSALLDGLAAHVLTGRIGQRRAVTMALTIAGQSLGCDFVTVRSSGR